MRRSFLFPTMLLLSILLGGCEREKPVVEMPAEEPVTRMSEMSAEEVAAKWADFSRRAENDDSLWQSAERVALDEVAPAAFKKLLIKRIRESENVTITEMSYISDFTMLHMRNILAREQTPQYDYASTNLTGGQKDAFLKAAEAIDLSIPTWDSYCGFVPHHRLEMTDRNGEVSRMLICYACSTIQWEEYPGLSYPAGLFDALEVLMKAADMEIEMDWQKMAEERYTKEKDAAAKGR